MHERRLVHLQRAQALRELLNGRVLLLRKALKVVALVGKWDRGAEYLGQGDACARLTLAETEVATELEKTGAVKEL